MPVNIKIDDAVALVPRKILFGNPAKTSLSISYDGKYMSYLAPNNNNVLNVWIRSVGQNDDRMVTSDNDRGVRIYSWRPDNKHLIYMQDTSGDENWHIFQTDIETGETKDLTPYTGSLFYVQSIDHKYPDEILVGGNKRDAHLMDIYRLNLNDGTLAEYTVNPGDVAGFGTDNDLKIRTAHVVSPDGGVELRVRKNDTAPWETLLRWGPDESGGGAAGFTPDGNGIYLISSVGANAARLLELSLLGGEPRVIAEDGKYDVSQLLKHPIKNQIQAVGFTRERSEWTVLDESLKDDFAFLEQNCRGCFYFLGRSLDDNRWIICDVVDNGSIRYLLFDRKSQSLELIDLAQAELENYTLANMKPIIFDARDGLKIHGYLTMPPQAEQCEKKPPLVLLVHGGPWGRDVWGFDAEAQWLANRGYAVLQINFRGSTGYGKDFYNAGDRQWGAKMHDDLIDGKRWAIAQDLVAPEKVAIFGTSYGGYATLVGMTFTPDEFVCGVDVVGPSNLFSLLSTVPPYWEPEKARFNKRVGNVDTERDFLESRSPLFKADQIKAPLLIAQGANDPRVKQAESDQIVESMRKNGQEVEYLLFEDEGHGFAKPENRIRFYTAAEKFLAKYLGGRSEP